MDVSVVVPWRPGCPWRERAWEWVRARYTAAHPSWEVVTGTCADGPFNRSEAILDGASRASGDVLVVADSDVWCDPSSAVDRVTEHGWAIPHLLIYRLSEAATNRVLLGSDWRGQSLSDDNPQDRRPYKGHPAGTLVVLRADVLADVPPDRRFIGWGQEDDAWAAALNTLVGRPWRGADDLVHLWHPPQERMTRIVGNTTSARLGHRYARARRNPAAMRALLEEAR